MCKTDSWWEDAVWPRELSAVLRADPGVGWGCVWGREVQEERDTNILTAGSRCGAAETNSIVKPSSSN